MKKFPHQQFIEDNHLDIHTFPKMLQKRIQGFDELEEDLQHTTEHDKEILADHLETLSHELVEDLEEHFGDDLENNDLEDEPVIKESMVEEPVSEEEHPLTETFTPEQEQETKESVQEIIEELPKEEFHIEPEPVKEHTDEELLEELFTNKKRIVLPAELKEKGFRTDLQDRMVSVGKFCLYRGKYDTCYKIMLKN